MLSVLDGVAEFQPSIIRERQREGISALFTEFIEALPSYIEANVAG